MNKNNININALRVLGIDMINKANSGHPGIVLGAAPMMYSLYTKFINVNVNQPTWINRDRFVLSAGHGSALLYSMLHLAGFNLPMQQLQQFRQLNSHTPGHPEYGMIPGVDATTGPLGQGIAMAVGMATAETHLAAIYNKPGFDIIDHFTYVICGDGDLQEGVALEAISFAGRYKLNKLIVLHDSNDIQLDAPVKVAQSTNMKLLFEANNWNTLYVGDGEDCEAIANAIQQAKQADKPTYIEVKTVIGHGAPKQGTTAVHGAPLGKDLDATKQALQWEYAPFEIPQEVYNHYKTNVNERGLDAYNKWLQTSEQYKIKYPELAKQLDDAVNGKFSIDEDIFIKHIPTKPQATRISSGQVLDILSQHIPSVIGGSADLSASTKARGADGDFDINNRTGRNIMYGVREFAMGAINNGIALHKGLYPFASGFFVFADYLKPAIRLGALMNIHNLYIFTHDSLAVGEDGPTHEPVEQLAMLRSIPELTVYRPADFQETYCAYLLALERNQSPSVIVASRQDLPELPHKDVYQNVSCGAYAIAPQRDANISIIASGSEVHLAIETKNIIEDTTNLKVKVISMVSQELFNQQDVNYQQSIIDASTFRVTLELGSTFGWGKFSGDYGLNIGWDEFGFSGEGVQVLDHVGFNAPNIAKRIIDAYNKQVSK